MKVRSIIRHGPLRSSDLAHLGALLLSSIQPGRVFGRPGGSGAWRRPQGGAV